MKKSNIIKQRIIEGKRYSEIKLELGVSIPTISYHAKKLGISRSKHSCINSSNVEDIQNDIDCGLTLSDICLKYNFGRGTLLRANKKGIVNIPSRKLLSSMSLDEILLYVKGRKTSAHERKIIKNKLIKSGIPYVCNECGINEWRGNKLTLELDHIDGNNKNNTRNNFRLLCLNCHSCTLTWRGRNKKNNR